MWRKQPGLIRQRRPPVFGDQRQLWWFPEPGLQQDCQLGLRLLRELPANHQLRLLILRQRRRLRGRCWADMQSTGCHGNFL